MERGASEGSDGRCAGALLQRARPGSVCGSSELYPLGRQSRTVGSDRMARAGAEALLQALHKRPAVREFLHQQEVDMPECAIALTII